LLGERGPHLLDGGQALIGEEELDAGVDARQPSGSRSSRTDGACCSRAPAISFSACRSRAPPVPVLAPGTGKTKTGRSWVYLRDERPSGVRAPPAIVYRYSPIARASIRARIWPSSRASL
jgi:hypothetical protein